MAVSTGTNPKVGAVLAHDGKIIGEGYYKEWRGAHAEVRALASVTPANKDLISSSTLYVSLEPCCIHAKTPPCTEAVIAAGILRVHIGTVDPFPTIAGSGIAQLRSAGIEVTVHDDPVAKELIAPFVAFHIQQRPFITIKYAQSTDHYIAKHGEQTWLTNSITGVYTHRLRAGSDAILVGTATAIIDNPSLTTRHYPGSNPVRLVIDKNNAIPASHHLLCDDGVTVIFNNTPRVLTAHNKQQITTDHTDKLADILSYCHTNGLMHLLVEGGAKLIKSLVSAQLWDKAIVITSANVLEQGVKAPLLTGKKVDSFDMAGDFVHVIRSQHQQ